MSQASMVSSHVATGPQRFADRVKFTVQNALTAITDARTRRVQYRTTFAELSKLTDRELADIGVARSNIRRVAQQHFTTGENA